MIDRYAKEEMKKVWSEYNKFRLWLFIELTVLKAKQIIGELKIPFKIDVVGLMEKIKTEPGAIKDREDNVTKHDVKAFLDIVSLQLPKELRPFLHKGMTSYDIVDNAQILQMVASLEIIISKTEKLKRVIKKLAFEHKYTLQIGRTHGQHAELITFGVKLANWYAALDRSLENITCMKQRISVGKLSGAVGMYTMPPKIEELVCKELELKPIISTQIISRDIHSDFVCTLSILAAMLGKIAVNIRLLCQTEIDEIREPFGKTQTGSSAMPHKKNPIATENTTGLMRVATSCPITALENLANDWHERSLDNSSSERVILPDLTSAIDYSLSRMIGIFEGLQVFPENMTSNIKRTDGRIFSQEVMMLITESGISREEAHNMVKRVSNRCQEKKLKFFEEVSKDSEIAQHSNTEELMALFDLVKKTKQVKTNVDYIFNKIFKS